MPPPILTGPAAPPPSVAPAALFAAARAIHAALHCRQGPTVS